MKSWKLLLLFLTVIAFATGCASLEAPNTESLLSASGFVTKTPATAKQQAFSSALPPFELQRETIKGQTVYVYADKKNDVIYFGDQQAYQKYQQLSLQQQIAEENLMASEMDQESALDWNSWGPWGGFWD